MYLYILSKLGPVKPLPLGTKNSVQSPVVNTIFSFVDRQRTKEVTCESTTDTALAELYAQVQAMPESAQKKRLIAKLNDANGYGTPKIRKPFISKTPHANVTDTFDSFKNWITPLKKGKTTNMNTGGSLKKGGKKEKPIGRSGSYSLKQKKHSEMITLDEQAAPHSFKRCTSEPQDEPNDKSKEKTFIATSDENEPSLKTKMSPQIINLENNQTKLIQPTKNDVDKFHIPSVPTVPNTSVQKRAPPPIPPRVSSLKPRVDTPQSPCCILPGKADNSQIGIAITPAVSSTPLSSGKRGILRVHGVFVNWEKYIKFYTV